MSIVTGLLLPKIESDGKQIVTPKPMRPGFRTWFTGRGDDRGPPVVRGGGPAMRVTYAANETGVKTQAISFSEPVEVHDGQAFYTPVGNWSPDDSLSCYILLPAVAPTSTPGTGNCNSVPTGLGYNILIPAAGNGSHTLDLALATPIPVSDPDNPNGYWDANYETGTITASPAPGVAQYHLFDNVPVTAYMVMKLPLGNPLGVFDVETYGVEWIHQNWQVVTKVEKNFTAGTASDLTGWLLLFRKTTT